MRKIVHFAVISGVFCTFTERQKFILLRFCYVSHIVPRAASAGHEIKPSLPTHHSATVGIITHGGVALNGHDVIAVYLHHNAAVFGNFLFAGEVEHHNVARLEP